MLQAVNKLRLIQLLFFLLSNTYMHLWIAEIRNYLVWIFGALVWSSGSSSNS